jgi:hypothetical protein
LPSSPPPTTRPARHNIQVIDPLAGFATRKQFSVGNGADPEDIVFQNSSRAFVSRYNEDQMWIVNPNTGQRSGMIDFAWLADADNVPEMAHMVKTGNRVFVAVQRLNRNGGVAWPPVGPSYIAVFDATTEQFVDAVPGIPVDPITLAGTNPFGELVFNAWSGKIWVPDTGNYGVNDGGIELIDPVALTTSGIVLGEAALGGDITDVVALDATHGAAIISDSNFNTVLVGFDLSVPAVTDTIYAPGSFALQDAEVSRDGNIFVSDRTPVAPGIRIFHGTNHVQVTTKPVDVGLPPADIEFFLTN